ncbi:MAG: YihY/virulence factor BrkB family protein [Alphaproteobacteria bacterium]|nr:YihY/virulence factor BrkB family protein [Alphaproteobacteria bacterium]
MAADNTVNHDGIEHAGYLAFLGLLALFPFLVFLVALTGAFGEDFAKTELVDMIITNLPEHVVIALQPRMLEITTGPSQGLLTVAILGAIWTSSSAVEGLRTVLNRAYRVHTPPSYLWRRLLSILQLIILTVIVIIGMGLLVVWPIVWQYLQTFLPFDIAEVTSHISNLSYIIGSLLLFFVVSSLYYVLPNVKQTWISVFPGAALVVVGWLAAAQLISVYLARFDQVNIIYGSLGGIIAALLFFYLLGVIFIYGAEFSFLLKRSTGERIEEREEVPEDAEKPKEKN